VAYTKGLVNAKSTTTHWRQAPQAQDGVESLFS
jgi:hypothetical protein